MKKKLMFERIQRRLWFGGQMLETNVTVRMVTSVDITNEIRERNNRPTPSAEADWLNSGFRDLQYKTEEMNHGTRK